MPTLLRTYERFPYLFPIVSALALVLTLPPFNFWPIILIALVPLYLFIIHERDIFRIFTGVLFFALLFSGYLSHITLFSFTWIPEAHLFSTVVKALSIPLVLFISIITALAICLLKTEKAGLMPLERTILFGIFAVVEWMISHVFIGFNYGSLAYAASHILAFRFMASIGGTFLVSFLVVFGNAALAEALRFPFQTQKRKYTLFIPLGIFLLITGSSFAYQNINQNILNAPAAEQLSVSVAIIQDTAREERMAFGTVAGGSFHFPLLEKRLTEALILHPDIIIYPFSPWIGVIADTLDNSRFTKDVIGMDYGVFKKWLLAHIPQETIFVTWDTRLDKNGGYWNEVAFWKNGALIGSYDKRRLFPFMDYTPQWAAALGLYSTPYDGTAGTSTAPILIGSTAIGNLICSEVSRPESAIENGRDADVLFAIGSESMFTNPVASEFNLLNAQFRATESGRPIIRANKFGPSAFIDVHGNIIQSIPYNHSGILFVEVPAQTAHKPTIYSTITEYPFVLLLVSYVLFLSFLGFLWSRKIKRPWYFWFLRLRRLTKPPEINK